MFRSSWQWIRSITTSPRTKLLVVTTLFASGASSGFAQTASYDASTQHLTLPSVQVLDTTYTDVVVRLGSVVVLELGSPAPASSSLTSARYDPSQRTLTLPSVTALGTTYHGLVARIDSFELISVGVSSPIPLPAPAVKPYDPYYGY